MKVVTLRQFLQIAVAFTSAREFWAWLKSRNAQMSMSLEGGTDFASAAATSVRPTEQTDMATRVAGAESACHTPGK